MENAFGILASRFGVFQKPINLRPEKTALITLACCYLHNFLIKTNQNFCSSKNVFIEENIQTSEIENGSEITGNLLTPLKKTPAQIISLEAKTVRDKYYSYFCREGQVRWQFNMICPFTKLIL